MSESLRPPYLLTTVAGNDKSVVGVTGDAGIAVVELAVYGRWSPLLAGQVSEGLDLCLAGPSRAIIVDLHEVADPLGDSVPFWRDAWQRFRQEEPPAQLALCLPAAMRFDQRLALARKPGPEVYTGMPQARAAIAAQTSRADHLEARLRPVPASVRAARELVSRACLAWNLPGLLQDALLVVSELAANAVEHACTDFVVTLSRTGAMLHVAVRDGISWFPLPRHRASVDPPSGLEHRGRGLRLVHHVASGWGAMPALGGKVVWASVA
ncbi:hypothetical protein GCM10010435_26130 [Winogradskya consettensis]|uniref:Histidine kinase/HSP90-like ATPase domain-containing protein n=1 Tax=Winogradskya consettensis TaxID=113560 RepID=A0A919SAK5_9ACTN|nr:ATP-binding protein [Actinoplanes consettensis]GIM68028.1 hypothetical protein Aco04nite_08920 [Actinoplanes consettensis]